MFYDMISDRKAFMKKLIALPDSPSKKKLLTDLVVILRLSDIEIVNSVAYTWFYYKYGGSPVEGTLIPKYLMSKQIDYPDKEFFSYLSDLFKLTIR
jgi:hypothetical protein